MFLRRFNKKLLCGKQKKLGLRNVSKYVGGEKLIEIDMLLVFHTWSYYLWIRVAAGVSECSATLDDSVSEEEEESSFEELADGTPYLQPGVELSVLNEVMQKTHQFMFVSFPIHGHVSKMFGLRTVHMSRSNLTCRTQAQPPCNCTLLSARVLCSG